MDLRRLLAIARPWFPVLIALTLVGGVGAYLLSRVQPRTYEARATLIVGQSLAGANPDYNQLLVSQRLSATYATIATIRPNLEAVIEKLDLNTTPEALLSRVDARSAVDSTLITLTAEDANPEQAAAIANALADQLIATSSAVRGRDTEFQASIDADLRDTQTEIEQTRARADALTGLAHRTPEQDAQLAALETRLGSLRSTYATLLSFSSGGVSDLISVIEPAVPPDVPISPRPLINAILGGVLGLLIAIGIAAAVTYFRDVVRDAEEVFEVTGLSTLGMIARMRGGPGHKEIYRLAPLLYPRSDVAEAYRMLRANVAFAAGQLPIRTLLVTGSIPDEGKTVTAANLAVVFAQSGIRVVLVDGDLRKPGVHLIFDLPNAAGLTTLLADKSVAIDTVAQVTEQGNLTVITSGPLPPNPAELLGSQRMRGVLERLALEAELIILDSPPLLAVTDSAVLSAMVDGTLLVINSGRSRRRAVRAARQSLARAGANVLGVALNRVPRQAGASYHGYGGDRTGKDAETRAQATDTSPGGSVI